MNKQIMVWMATLMVTANIAEAEQGTLAALQAAYSNASARIATDTQKQRDDALLQYGKNLDAILKTIKQKGDIDGYGIVEQEFKRVQVDKTVLTNTSSDYIAKAIVAYQQQVAVAKTDSDRRTVFLLKQYIAALNDLVKNLMARDKIADAKAAGDERHTAEFMLAETAEGLPKVKPQEVKASDRSVASGLSLGTTTATVRWNYLSDINEKAATVGFAQFVKGKLTFRDTKITIGGEMPHHGLYAHAPSAITYDLPDKAYVALKGRVGLADGSWGEVQFIVLGDGRELWKSPVVKKEHEGRNPKTVQFSLDITGVRELVLKVDPLGSQTADHAVWVDPQVGK